MISSGPRQRMASVGILVCSLISIPRVSSAQTAVAGVARPEVFVSSGLGVVFHGIDDDIPVRGNFGGGVAIRLRPRLGVEFEVSQNLGRSGRWGAVGVASANVTYFFSAERARAYVSGGLGVLWSDQAFFKPPASFEVRRDTALAWNIGLGVRIPIGRLVSLRPEFRGYSNKDLRIFRTSIAIGYQW